LKPPELLDAAIIYGPVGPLIPAATAKGAIVVCAGFHMSELPGFPYRLLWGEHVLRSVANLTRRDGEEFLALAPQIPIRVHVQTYPLRDANAAIHDLCAGRVTGIAVLVTDAAGAKPREM
jgi:propanol-preferring alcohol dehydrogenase